MRSDPAEYTFVSPASLAEALDLLCMKPGNWLPVAGGTEVMVQYSAGKLAARNLLSLWGLPELSEIAELEDSFRVGGGCTFAQLREHEAVQRFFPMLATAAAWTGSIANQNRATLAGNIVNASPAADSPPSLLAYEAELELISATETRRLPYNEFHLGYKKTALRPEELVLAVHLPKHYENWFTYTRKVGSREAQAISKICIAGAGKLKSGSVESLHIGIGAVAPTPLRLHRIESMLLGKQLTKERIAESKLALQDEISPIEDIRSSVQYRRQVAENLLEDLLLNFALLGEDPLTCSVTALDNWNGLDLPSAVEKILPCCASVRWADRMASARPITNLDQMLEVADKTWLELSEQDWNEAFRSHPRIGERKAASVTSQSAAWSSNEQSGAATTSEEIQHALKAGNEAYETRFGRTYIVCATGRSAEEMLLDLHRRLRNTDRAELQEAVEQQRQITRLRLRKWLEL
jgi:OHCU decarboxylase